MGSLLEDVESSMAEGFEAIELYDFRKAERIARRLIKAKHSSGFEILARSHYEQGKPSRAIEVLREGARLAPDTSALWILLAFYQSEQGHHAEAHSALRRAADCENADPAEIMMVRSTVLALEERYGEALEQVDQVAPDTRSMVLQVLAQRLYLLNQLGRHDEVLSCSQPESSDTDGPDEETAISNALTEAARASRELARDSEQVAALALRSLAYSRNNQQALFLLRESRGRRTSCASRFVLLLEASGGNLDFFVQIEAVAETPEEALQYAAEVLPLEPKHRLRIDEVLSEERAGTESHGVYWSSGLGLWKTDDSTNASDEA